MNRRQFLAVLGGGTIVAATGATAMVASRETRTALLPRERAGQGYADPRARALSWAILAPNPHNRQPWLVDLSEPGRATLFVDTERMLPHTDPFNRQITVGLGCFVELAAMAAAQDGIALTAELFPEGSDAARLDGRPVAVLHLDGQATPDPLFAFALARRSLKEPYDTGAPVSRPILDTVLAAARRTSTGGSVAAQDIAAMRALTHEALRIENTRRWRRSTRRCTNASPPVGARFKCWPG